MNGSSNRVSEPQKTSPQNLYRVGRKIIGRACVYSAPPLDNFATFDRWPLEFYSSIPMYSIIKRRGRYGPPVK